MSVLKRDISKSNQDFIDISGINANMLHLSTFKPLVTFYWTYLISLLNYKDRTYYSNFLVQSSIEKHLKNPSINKEIARTGCLISLCDFLVSFISLFSRKIIWNNIFSATIPLNQNFYNGFWRQVRLIWLNYAKRVLFSNLSLFYIEIRNLAVPF